jgi:hypothetical protein
MIRRLLVIASVAVATSAGGGAWAQFLDAAPSPTAGGPTLGDVRVQHIKVGLVVTAAGGRCQGLYATMPVPADWPEQRVRVVAEDVSPGVRGPIYRTLGAGVRQMVVEIPELAAGRQARAVVTFEVERSALVPPEETGGLRIPQKPGRELREFLGPSPYIESRHPKIVRLAREAAGDLEGWQQVEALYDTARAKVEYRNGELKGAARALADGWGDCEELTSLFIAMARAQGIPARMVWVEGHCYPEFHLVDDTGSGWWFPCQAAGTRAFGGMPDQLPILQKGDNFRDPDRPGKPLRYVSEFLRGSTGPGSAAPHVQWIREGA